MRNFDNGGAQVTLGQLQASVQLLKSTKKFSERRLAKMRSEQIDPEDRIKLDTWYHLTNLLDEYHMLAFDPMHQRGLGLFASHRDKEMRKNKLKALLTSRSRLVEKWEKALGPKWRDALIQQD